LTNRFQLFMIDIVSVADNEVCLASTGHVGVRVVRVWADGIGIALYRVRCGVELTDPAARGSCSITSVGETTLLVPIIIAGDIPVNADSTASFL
jgi:hypothetical protein